MAVSRKASVPKGHLRGQSEDNPCVVKDRGGLIKDLLAIKRTKRR